MVTWTGNERRTPQSIVNSRVWSSIAGALGAAAVPPQATPGITSHCQLALARLVDGFCDSTKLRNYICAVADECQVIEQELSNILAFRSIDTAYGVGLDQIGLLYSELRQGLLDDVYRALLRAKTKVISSRGQINEILDILVTLDNGFDPGSIQLKQHFPAAFVTTMRVPQGPTGQAIGLRAGRFVGEAKGAGINSQVHFEQSGATMFVWSGNAGAGWSETGSPSEGGIWAEGVGPQ